ncbi:MAG: hypothetical protein P8X60_08100, partial [Robiginitalea sp.]
KKGTMEILKSAHLAVCLLVITIVLQACSSDSNSDYGSTNETSIQDASTTEPSPDQVNTSSLEFDVTNIGASSYVFNSDDLTDEENPNITLKRGSRYTFRINAPGHPFFINSVQGTSDTNAYNDGVTNNGTESGTITFEVPADAPDTLFYNCEFHASMTGIFTIED